MALWSNGPQAYLSATGTPMRHDYTNSTVRCTRASGTFGFLKRHLNEQLVQEWSVRKRWKTQLLHDLDSDSTDSPLALPNGPPAQSVTFSSPLTGVNKTRKPTYNTPGNRNFQVITEFWFPKERHTSYKQMPKSPLTALEYFFVQTLADQNGPQSEQIPIGDARRRIREVHYDRGTIVNAMDIEAKQMSDCTKRFDSYIKYAYHLSQIGFCFVGDCNNDLKNRHEYNYLSRRTSYSLLGTQSSSPGPPACCQPTPQPKRYAPTSLPYARSVGLAETLCTNNLRAECGTRIREAPDNHTPRARDTHLLNASPPAQISGTHAARVQQESTRYAATDRPVETRWRELEMRSDNSSDAHGGDQRSSGARGGVSAAFGVIQAKAAASAEKAPLSVPAFAAFAASAQVDAYAMFTYRYNLWRQLSHLHSAATLTNAKISAALTCCVWNCDARATLNLFTPKSWAPRTGRLSAGIQSAKHAYSRFFKPTHQQPIRFYLQLCAHYRTPTVTFRGAYSHI